MNNNLKGIEISGIRKIYNEVQKVPGAISLTLGQPDFAVPRIIKDYMIKAIEEDNTVYTANAGVTELREAISNYLSHKGVHFSSDEICVTVGGSEALFSVFTALINKGDKVLIPTPAYPAYENIVKVLGGEVVNYVLKEDFSINIDKLESLIIKSKAKYIVLSLPSNPTGAVLTKEDKNSIIDLVKKYDITIITDEIYEALSYENYESVAQCEDILSNIIYISGFSKMFSMTGLRVGYFACKKSIYEEIMKVHQYNVSCATSISQYAAVAGLKYALDSVEEMKSILQERCNYVVNRLKDIGFDVQMPKGAFYVFPSIKKFNISSEEFCMRLLKEYKVACVPGNAFGIGGEGYIRISYCYSDEELKTALDKIELFIKTI